MWARVWAIKCLLVLALVAPGTAGSRAATGATAWPTAWRVLLLAGYADEAAFDNARRELGKALIARGVPAGNIQMLSAAGREGRPATLAGLAGAFQRLARTPGDGCLVFMTSHGEEGRGLHLPERNEFLTPRRLDALLAQPCGAQPTVVVMSGCYSGLFLEESMRRPNRVILTAARRDRPSFGCRAGRTYTVFDHCLLKGMNRVETWEKLHAEAGRCVGRKEERLQAEPPSEPQGFFGVAVRHLPLPSPGQ